MKIAPKKIIKELNKCIFSDLVHKAKIKAIRETRQMKSIGDIILGPRLDSLKMDSLNKIQKILKILFYPVDDSLKKIRLDSKPR